MIALHEIQPLDLRDVRLAPWNSNKVAKATLNRIRKSLAQFGSVENLVVRPGWCVGARSGDDLANRKVERSLSMDEPWFECLSGNHRLTLYRESGLPSAFAVVVELTDAKAKILAQALNRLGGKDDKDKLKELLVDVLKDETPMDVASILPYTENDLLKLINGDVDETTPDVPDGPADSQLGVIYELGPHRLLCGDSCDIALVGELLAGATPTLMATDPPYGVELSQGWRDRIAAADPTFRRTNGSLETVGLSSWGSQSDTLEGDDGVDWMTALGLPHVDVAYVWHADKYSSMTEQVLQSHGFDVRQQIIWRKPLPVLGRAAYHWQHESAWYAVRKGVTAPWHGGRNQSTIWDGQSPRQPIGRTAEADGKEDHPTQKPLTLFERPIVNHLSVGEIVYDPFLGSGTCLIAAAKTDRVCYGAEIAPKYADLVRRRWTAWAVSNGRDPGPGALQ